jgi:hypothetical protein
MKEIDNNLINKFFDEEYELKPEELQEFKDKYDLVPGFRQAVNDQTQLIAALKAVSNIDAYNSAVNPEPIEKKPVAPVVHIGRDILRIAAVFVPLAVLGTFLFYFTASRRTLDSFVAKGIEMTTKTEDYRGFTNRWGSKSEQLQQQIDNAILSSLDELVGSEETYYFGIKSAQEKRFNEAIFAFKRVINSGDKIHSQDSEWLLALCYVKTGETEKAKSLLSTMANSKSHKYSEESGKMLKKIRF